MGRGRAKAKQTKVARELKYYSPDTDLTALQRELASGGFSPALRTNHRQDNLADESDDADSPYADLVDKYADDDSDDEARR